MPIRKSNEKKGKKKKEEQANHEDDENIPPPPPPMAGDDFAVPVKEVRVPHNQLKLTEQQLEEEIAKMLTANNPEAPKNTARFHQKERCYKFEPMVEQHIVHFSTDGWLLHRESEEARKQIEMEKLEREAVNKFQAELDKASKEKKDDGGEAEPPDDTKQLRNQFNYGERAAQTFNLPLRDRDTFTEPPPTANMNETCSQWGIYDEYIRQVMLSAMECDEKPIRQMIYRDIDRQKQIDEQNKAKAQAKKGVVQQSQAPSSQDPRVERSDPLQTDQIAHCVKILERMVNQNSFDQRNLDFKYWDDPTDEVREQEGSLLPLWQFKLKEAPRKHVTSIAISPQYSDLFVVGLGSFDYLKQSSGLVCIYSFKNPTYPESKFKFKSGVMSLDFHPQHANLLVVGLYDGQIMVYDLRQKSEKPIYQSSVRTGKHTEPVWEIRWQGVEAGKPLSFYSASTDGNIYMWNLTKAELVCEQAMQLKVTEQRTGGVAQEQADLAMQTLTGGLCLDFNKEQDDLYLVGTQEGNVQLCSKAYSSEYLKTYKAHNMAVYAVKWNIMYPDMFLTASGDWMIKLWDRTKDQPIMTFDLQNDVGDVAWAPYSATVFGAVTNNGKVRLYDLAINRHEAICEQQVVPSTVKLTKIVFNTKHPVILVGDERGVVHCLKLSPNLRKAMKEVVEKGKTKEQIEKQKLDQVIDIAKRSNLVSQEAV